MNATAQRIGALAACFVAAIIAVCWRMEIRAAGSRDPEAMANLLDQPETKIASSGYHMAAAAYLDQRAAWWMEWPKAARFSFQADRGDSPSPLDLWSRRL